MKAIILGCGRQGSLLTQMLEDENIDVTVIDRDSSSFSRLDKFKGKKVLGDGVREKTLERAGIVGADVFAALTNNDNTNLMAAQIARGIFHVPKVVCRVYDPRRAVIYADLGLDTVNYSLSGAHLIKSYIIGSAVAKKFQLGDGSGMAIEIPLKEKFAGKKVQELDIPGKFHVASIIRGLKVIITKPDLEIKAGDHIFGVVMVSGLREVLEKFEVGPREEKHEDREEE